MTKFEFSQVQTDRLLPFWWSSWLSDKTIFTLGQEFDKVSIYERRTCV